MITQILLLLKILQRILNNKKHCGQNKVYNFFAL
jgi:hypothetical protein